MDKTETLHDIVSGCAGEIGGPVTALRRVVAEFGFVDAPHMEVVADVFNLSLAEVRGIVSFYADLRTRPAGRRHIRICQAEACQAVGGRELTRSVESELGIRLGETTADGEVTLDPVFCLGTCASGPSAMVDGSVVVGASVKALTS